MVQFSLGLILCLSNYSEELIHNVWTYCKCNTLLSERICLCFSNWQQRKGGWVNMIRLTLHDQCLLCWCLFVISAKQEKPC